MNNTRTINIALILIPTLCVLGGAILGVIWWKRFKKLEAEYAQTQQQIVVANAALDKIAALPEAGQAPTAAQSAREQADFLNQLHFVAKSADIQIINWSNLAVASDPATPTPSGIIAINSTCEITGDFRKVRKFLYGLQSTPRLLNLSLPRWSRGAWPTTRLLFNLTRYVSPEAKPITGASGLPVPASPGGAKGI